MKTPPVRIHSIVAPSVDSGSPCYPIADIVPGAWRLRGSEGRLAHSRSIVYMMARLAWHVRFSRADIGKPKMLRITVQEDGSLWRLHLGGRLAGAWVAETEN